MNIKNKISWLFVWALCLFPIVLWVSATSLIDRFNLDFGTAIGSFGQVAGLVGTAMFAVSLFLSARLKIFEKYFGGLNGIYERHNQFGQMALILLILHPLLLLFKYAGSFTDAVAFLLPSSNWDYNFGIFSLGLMIFLIVLTLYLRPRYNIWKFTHKFLGFAFFLGGLHVWFIPSDTSQYLPLRIYMLGLVAIALIAFFYRTVFEKFFVSKLEYEVVSVSKLNNSIVEITLKPLRSILSFISGQFVFLQFVNSPIGSESHPFSIASSSTDKFLKIAIKNLGDYTSKLASVGAGTKALIEGPFGTFSYEKANNKEQIWIAGGVGITPFVSMARSISDYSKYKIDLLYCVRNGEEAVYLDDFRQIASNSDDHFSLNLFCSNLSGRVNIDYIKATISGNLADRDIFICAPPGMIHSMVEQFIQAGVSPQNIHSEEFNF